ncbi:MAG: hypothetical protein ACNI3C_12225 [Candidatus Marinarcus sp.]|uniref:hypothetical protein n=1 Tax=Candidatus Marinarcus sp. TaxID=3100987 RepID=UPI003B009D1F
MAKGKKVAVKEIKKLEESVVLVNGKEYLLLEECANVEEAISMKISSNGNRLLRFKDEKKIAHLDVKREIDIVKYTFKESEAAKKFLKTHEKALLTKGVTKEIIGNTNAYSKAKALIAQYSDKKSEKYDANANCVYLFEEII